MAKKKYKSLLATGLAIAGAVQLGTSVKANALTKLPDGFFNENNVNVISAEEAERAVEENKKNYDSTGQLYIVVHKGENHNPDRNMEIVHEVSKKDDSSFYRYTHEDGTPYTGLYLSTYTDKGTPIEWVVLDENGCLRRDPQNPQYAWLDGKLSADFLYNSLGPNHDPSTGNWYLTDYTYIDGGEFHYILFDKWREDYGGKVWYRSDKNGVCYRNQWFQDTDGKWYYFDDKCRMVTNTLVNGYWIGADGVCQTK